MEAAKWVLEKWQKKEWKRNNPFILPFPLKRCLPLHPSSPLCFQEQFGKMYLNKTCVCVLVCTWSRACAVCSLPWKMGSNVDILWRSEDQRVSHLNYTPTRKHRWASNEETSAGFTGNLSHIFLRTCSVDARVAGMHVLVLEKLVMRHHCAHCFQRPQQLSYAINHIGISNQVETSAIWDRHLRWNRVVPQPACGLTERQISTAIMT